MNKSVIAVIASLVVALGALVHAIPVDAQANEECLVSFNGIPIDGNIIKLRVGDGIGVRVVAPENATRNDIYVKFFGRRIKLTVLALTGGKYQGTTGISDLTDWGVGLYELLWESIDDRGEIICRAAGRIQIIGSPLSSVAGMTAVGAIALGLTAMMFTLKATINAGARWAIKVVLRAKLRRGGDSDDDGGRLRVGTSMSVSQTLLGTLGGLLMGGGSLTMLQQAAVSPPTIELALLVVVPFTVLGLVAGLFRPGRERRSP